MKKSLLSTAVAIAMASSMAYAHHPAAEIVDPEIYAMIDENVSDVHAAMTFDDMGGDTTAIGSVEASPDAPVLNAGEVTGGDIADVSAEFGVEAIGDVAEVGQIEESREEMNAMAEDAPQGTRGPGRSR